MEILFFDDSADENRELLKKRCLEEKNKINVCDCDCEKDFMKIKFNSDDDLLLNKALKFHAMTITIRSVFEEDGKLYPQVF